MPQDVQIRAKAAIELSRALSRYDRLASPPRWLRIPIVCDIDRSAAVARRCRELGNAERADAIEADLEREYERRARLDGWRGRSAVAWQRICTRLWNARLQAILSGLFAEHSESWNFVTDRIRDAMSLWDIAERLDGAPGTN